MTKDGTFEIVSERKLIQTQSVQIPDDALKLSQDRRTGLQSQRTIEIAVRFRSRNVDAARDDQDRPGRLIRQRIKFAAAANSENRSTVQENRHITPQGLRQPQQIRQGNPSFYESRKSKKDGRCVA